MGHPRYRELLWSGNALKGLAQIRSRPHKGDNRGKSRRMFQGIVAELGIVMENATNERQNAVAKIQIILVIHTIKRHMQPHDGVSVKQLYP